MRKYLSPSFDLNHIVEIGVTIEELALVIFEKPSPGFNQMAALGGIELLSLRLSAQSGLACVSMASVSAGGHHIPDGAYVFGNN